MAGIPLGLLSLVEFVVFLIDAGITRGGLTFPKRRKTCGKQFMVYIMLMGGPVEFYAVPLMAKSNTS